MITLLLSVFPVKAIFACLAGIGACVAFLLKGRLSSVHAQNEKVTLVKAEIENHAVEQKEQAAKTDGDADAALDAAAHADHD